MTSVWPDLAILKGFVNKYPYKSSPNIKRPENITFLSKLQTLLFGHLFGKIGLLLFQHPVTLYDTKMAMDLFGSMQVHQSFNIGLITPFMVVGIPSHCRIT